MSGEDFVDYGVEPEVIEQFVDESEELLDSAANLFIILEQNPADEDAIHKVFRIVHTIKGNSAFFNLFKVKSLAHVLEDLMTAIRLGQKTITEQITNVLLQGIDKLKEMLDRVRESRPEVANEQELEDLIQQVKECMSGPDADWRVVFARLDTLKQKLPAELQSDFANLEQAIKGIAPDDEQDGQAGPPPQLAKAYLLLSKDFSDPLPDTKARQVHDLLHQAAPLLPTEGQQSLQELLEIYNATVPDNGFTAFLRDLAIERLTPWLATEEDPKTQKAAAIVADLSKNLGPEFVDPLPPERAGAVQQGLLKLKQLLPQHQETINDLLEVYDSTVASLGFTAFLRDLMIEKISQWESELVVMPDAQPDRANVLPDLIKLLSDNFEDPLPDDKCDIVYNSLNTLVDGGNPQLTVAAGELVEIYEATVPVTGFTSFLRDLALEKLESFTTKDEPEEKPESTTSTPDKPAAKPADKQAKAHAEDHNKTMRIAEASIDRFLDFVGELVVVGEMFTHVQRRLMEEVGSVKGVIDLRKSIEMFLKLSDDLQRSILEVRKMPIRNLTMRAPKMARDIAAAQNKKIKVVTIGDDTLIDKSLLETLDGPFAHLIRNSADHGIETAEERVRVGKPEQGTVTIKTYETDNDIFLEISDDGGGINTQKIRAKAVKNGLFTQEQADKLSEADARMLIFSAGLSTAEKITDVSGRGVGLDVVKKNVDRGNGKITIDSELGKGTTFTLQLPKAVTVKIILGMVFGVGQQRYIMPIDNIGESFNVEPHMFTTVSGRGRCILRHDRIIPILSLEKELGLGPNRDRGVGVTINFGNKQTILLVDKVFGVQKVVIKDISVFEDFSDFIIGGAILGNEEVSIVLNAEAFIR